MNQALLFALLLPFYTQASTYMNMQASVLIDQPIDKVFRFAGDAKNDYLWRDEVRNILRKGRFQKGTQYIEYARLGIYSNFRTISRISSFKRNTRVVYTARDRHGIRVKVYRVFQRTHHKRKTRFIYHLKVRKSVLAEMFDGLQPPVFLAQQIYQSNMQQYMWRLKQKLENR